MSDIINFDLNCHAFDAQMINMKIKNLIIFGTRPEAIKMAPLVKEFQKHTDLFETKVCVTAQHREMQDQVLDFFEIQPDYDLDLMKPNQNLYSLTAEIVTGLKPILEEYKPDFVYVHGDTTTSTFAGLAAFYAGARICHVEAGLRTQNKREPYPEEMNRQITGRLADIHFAPTQLAYENLIAENVQKDNIVITGNTVIDALIFSSAKVQKIDNDEINHLKTIVDPDKKLILVTGHRRENHGRGLINICKAIKTIALSRPETQIIYPVHLNPNVQKPVYEHLSELENISLINPLDYPAFVWLMQKSYMIITDSGGVQEEAPSLGKPVLVMRDTTERPEAVNAGTVVMVGTNEQKILKTTFNLLDNEEFYTQMSSKHNPYGDGKACKRIVEFMRQVQNENFRIG